MSRKDALGHDLLSFWMILWSWAPAVAAIVFAARYPHVWSVAIALAVVIARQHALFVVAHESWHKTLFRSPRLGRWTGRWLAAYPALIPWGTSRENHLEHHRKVGTLEDPDRYAWGWTAAERGSFVWHTLLTATGLPFLWRNTCALFGIAAKAPSTPAAHRGLRPAASPGHRADHAAIAACHAVLLATFALTVGYKWYFILWLWPAIGPRIALDETRQFLEHRDGQLLVFRSGRVERFFFGPFNFHLHAFHHAFASEPWFSLSKLERRARERETIGVRAGYVRELMAFLGGVPREEHAAVEPRTSITAPPA